jgi:hypothetical protein
MQYMKSTFAEDVEREKQRLAEYSTIKPPDGMMAAIEAGFGAPVSNVPAPAPTPAVAPLLTPIETPRAGATAILGPTGPGGDPIRRTPSLTALPKLTAAAATPAPKDDESAATMLVDSNEYFDDNDEPKTQPGRAVTPLESRRVGLGDGEAPTTGKTAVIGAPQGANPSRTATANIPLVTPSPNIQVRPSVFGMPAVSGPSETPSRPSNPGRAPGDGLPRIARPEGPSGGPPMLSPGGSAQPSRPPPLAAPTTPSLPPLGARPVAQPPVSRPPRDTDEDEASDRPKLKNQGLLFGALGAVALVALLVAGFLLTRSPPAVGFIMVELPPGVKDKAQVLLNTQPAPVSNGVVLQQVAAGPVIVAVSVEGYKAFTQTVTVQEGTQVTRVAAELESLVKSVSMVLAVVPQDAEVKLNGKVIRAQGSQDAFIKDLPASDEMLIEVQAPGFKSHQQKYTPPAGSEPLQVMVRLEPAELSVRVESEPEGATILASGKELGAITPAVVKLPAGVKQVTLRMKCFDDAELPVPSSTGDTPVLKGALKKQPGCK